MRGVAPTYVTIIETNTNTIGGVAPLALILIPIIISQRVPPTHHVIIDTNNYAVGGIDPLI